MNDNEILNSIFPDVKDNSSVLHQCIDDVKNLSRSEFRQAICDILDLSYCADNETIIKQLTDKI